MHNISLDKNLLLCYNQNKINYREKSMIALDKYLLFPMGFAIFLEIFLSGLIIALIGAAGYTFFVYSMKDDRADKRMNLYYNNPWEKVNKQADMDKQRKSRREKGTVIGIILLISAVIVSLLLIWVIHIVYPGIKIS